MAAHTPYFCHIHVGLYVPADDGSGGCHHSACMKLREGTLDHDGPYFNINRLKEENRTGISGADMEKSIIKEAEKEGRELARPSDYGY